MQNQKAYVKLNQNYDQIDDWKIVETGRPLLAGPPI